MAFLNDVKKDLKNEKNERTMKDKDLFKRLFIYMKPYKASYALGIFLMIVVVACDLISPYITSYSLAELGKENIDFSKVIFYFVLGLSITIVMHVVQYFQTMVMCKTGNKIIYTIRQDVFNHIQSLSHHQFNEIPVGTLVTRNTADTNVLYTLYTNVIVNVIKYVITIIGVLTVMFVLNYRLAFIILAVFPVILGLTILFRTILRVVHRNVRTQVSSMNAFLSENISGIKTTQIFNQEAKKYREFNEANNNLKKASLKEIFTFGVFRPSVYLIYITTVILVIYTGGTQFINFTILGVGVAITYNEFYAFYLYISKFFNPIQSLADQYNTLQSAFAAAEKIFTILDIKPEIVDEEDAIDIELKGKIEFKDVWFKYVEDEWILKGVSFTINPSDVVAFVGATGAGKSTILGLITRNYDIQKGQILIDGMDIKHIKIASLRRQIGQMLQDVFLFSGTIEENIRLNDPSITIDKIKAACDEVNATHFINKCPNGLNEIVGERGNNLSLGERQLISFARVIVHEPKVMILDEATSNIDTETEVLIQDSLEKVIKKNTMIMVAHRLSTIQHATKIYVFDHGQILESGSHQELLALHGRYYSLYELQYQKQLNRLSKTK